MEAGERQTQGRDGLCWGRTGPEDTYGEREGESSQRETWEASRERELRRGRERRPASAFLVGGWEERRVRPCGLV